MMGSSWGCTASKVRALLAGGLLVGSALPASADGVNGELEAGAIYYNLDHQFEDTYGAYARGRFASGPQDAWLGEVTHIDRFGDDGTYAAVGNTHDFNADWTSQVIVGASNGGFFLPAVKVDGSLSRRWLPGRNLVTSAGISYFDSKDIHSDVGYRAEATWYTESPWVVQGGVSYNVSDPGAVGSAAGYLALAHARNGNHIYTARVGGGEQAYQPLAEQRARVGVSFTSVRLSAKQWIGRHWGVNAVADSYFSSSYDQHGFEVGLFTEF